MNTVDSATAIPLPSLTYFHSVVNKTGKITAVFLEQGKVSVPYMCIRWESCIRSSFNEKFLF